MKKTILLIAAATALAFSGCTIEPAYVPDKPAPLPVAPAPARMLNQANANFSVSGEVNTKLRAFFKYPESEHNFALKLAQRLSERVVLEKADLVVQNAGDIAITLNPEFELLDQTGNYYRMICRQISVTIASPHKVYAVTTVTPTALPRKLGAQPAKDQYLAQAVDALVPFLKKELEKLSREQVAVSVVDFGLANVQAYPESQYIAGGINRITQILNTTPGIINFTNIRQDVASASCSFRIVYLKEHFPQGISNVLNLKLAGK